MVWVFGIPAIQSIPDATNGTGIFTYIRVVPEGSVWGGK